MSITLFFLVVALLLAIFSVTPFSSGKPLLAVSVILTIVALLIGAVVR